MSEAEEQRVETEQGPPEAVAVSSTSAQPHDEIGDAVEEAEESVNGCDSTTGGPEPPDATVESTSQEGDSTLDGSDKAETSSIEDSQKTEEPPPQTSESQSESDTPKTSRELKSILALSKEAKLDTNILTQRRKTSDKVKGTSKKSMKITSFPVTAESELENFDVKYEEKFEKRTAKKRKSSFVESVAEGAGGEEARRSQQGIVTDFIMPKKPNKDVFCWRCHHDCVQIACETCPRAYHLKCLKQTITDMEHWPCPECVAILKAENTQTRSKAMKGMSLEHLCSLLKFAVKRMIQCSGSEPFIHPVDEKQFPEYRSYIVQPMTLTMLEKNIKDNLYGSTQAFEADAKWILHNSIVFNSYQSKLTTAAKTIVKICKQEMAEIENCPSCYLNANTKKHTWFVEVCPKPHLLVWAKLKGFPYWPAKVMSINSSGMADVRFFGAHDKAWVSVKDCYLYSVKDPNSGKQKRNDIIECVKELELYVDNLREIYGRVNFAPFKTPLEADSQMKQLQVFLPNYGSDAKEIAKKIEKKIENRLLNKSVSSENLNDHSEDKSTESEEEEENDEEEEVDDVRKRRKSEENVGSGDKPVSCHVTKEGSMTRIDYRDTPSGKPKLIAKPIKAILVGKRNSTDAFGGVVKMARKTEPTRLSLDNHVKPKENTETVVQDEKKISPSPPKLKITDQLIKKLEDLVEDEKDSNKSEESETESSAKIEEIKEVPEKDEESKQSVPDQVSEDKSAVEEAEKEEEKRPEDTDKKVEDDTVKTDKSNDETTQIQEKSSDDTNVIDEDERSEDAKEMDVDMDETNIRNIIHSSLVSPEKNENEVNDSDKKRKREDGEDDEEKTEEENLFPPNKMVKLVPIENILQKKNDEENTTVTTANTNNNNKKQDQLIVLKEVRVVNKGKEMKNKTAKKKQNSDKAKNTSVEIKSEIESDEDDSDVQYMEAKRQYLSALNISEKQKVPIKPKAHEIRTRSKTEEKKSKSVESTVTKAAEDSSNRTAADSPQTKTPSTTTTTATGTPSTEPIKEIYIKSLSKMQTPKHKARKSFPTPNYNNSNKKTIVARKIIPKTSGNVDDELTIVNAATLQPTGNVMILPKLHYTKPLTINRDMSSPPVLTMLPRPNVTAAAATDSSKKAATAEGSQNYIPQNEEERSGNSGSGVLLNNLLSGGGGGNVSTPPVIDLDGVQNSADSELGVLKDMLPDNVTKGVSEILCQPPPKLKPKPVGILNNVVDSGVPSTAGPVATRINAMAQRLSDYFRGLLVETISEIGKSNNPEATISSLKYEIEELNHKHSIELAEIRRNVSIVLKDIQKSVVEERERVINETKANCEMETIKRVEEAKSKQWCANCSKEAQFYCCWNTSYCDYPCQQKHWLKHMSKCTQTAGQNQTGSTPVRSTGQQIVLTPTSAPKFGALFAKPQKVYLKRSTTPFKQTSGNHITLVESTPGNFELLGSGPITVNGKILASTSVIEKIKSGNIMTVTAPSGTTNTQLTSANQKVNPVSKSTANSSESEH